MNPPRMIFGSRVMKPGPDELGNFGGLFAMRPTKGQRPNTVKQRRAGWKDGWIFLSGCPQVFDRIAQIIMRNLAADVSGTWGIQ